MRPPDLTLRAQLTVVIVGLLAAVTVFIATYFPNRMEAQGRSWMFRHADGVALILANAVAPGLEFEDRKGVESQLGLLITSPEVEYVAVVTADGEIFAAWKPEAIPDDIQHTTSPQVALTEDRLHLARPIIARGGTTGTLVLGFSLDQLNQERQENRRAVGVVAFALFLFGAGMATAIGTFLVRPIHRLTYMAQEVAGGNLDVRGLAEAQAQPPPTGWRDEAKALASTVGAMARQLSRQIKEIDDQRRRAEAESDRARAAEEKALLATKAKSTFLANMSHELRTPLTAIMGYSTILQRELGKEHDQAIEDLKKINAAGQHLLELINDVLDLSKIEAGRIQLVMEPFDLGSLVDDVALSVHPLLDKNRNELEVLTEGDLSAVNLDRTRVRQILLNLLSNAAKFTKNGKITLKAQRIQESGDWVRLSVTDTGIGIPKEKQQTIFEAFSQADTSTTREYGGTGLGLAITRQFAQMMGGRVTLSSQTGRGSTFAVTLPASQLEVDPDITDAIATPVQEPDTILVIDDDQAVRDLMRRILESDGYRVVTAASGPEGIRLAEDVGPAAITLDVLMPGSDGWKVLTELKSNPLLKSIPVVMMSIVDEEDRAYALGAREFLTKPIDEVRLLEVLSRYRQADRPVLVVEDDDELREIARRSLESDGWRVREATTGSEALEVIQRERPGAILLDLMMPEMDGIELLDRLQQIDGGQDIPVVVMTAADLSEAQMAALSRRVEAVLAKGDRSTTELLDEVLGRVRQATLSKRQVIATIQRLKDAP